MSEPVVQEVKNPVVETPAAPVAESVVADIPMTIPADTTEVPVVAETPAVPTNSSGILPVSAQPKEEDSPINATKPIVETPVAVPVDAQPSQVEEINVKPTEVDPAAPKVTEDPAEPTEETPKKKSKFGKLLIIVLFVIFLALAGVLIYLNM